MKERGILLKSMLLLNLLVLLLTLADFLALHDIQNDYVSTKGGKYICNSKHTMPE